MSLLLGSGAHVLGFITEQAGRGLQVEAPAATFWLWRALAGEPGTHVYYDTAILTYQVSGHGVGAMAAATTPLLAVAVLAISVLGVLAVRRGVAPGDLLPTLALAAGDRPHRVQQGRLPAVRAAGSRCRVVLGIATPGRGPRPRRSARRGRSCSRSAASTQFIYPYLYGALLALDPFMLVVVTVRNLLYFVLLGWADLRDRDGPDGVGIVDEDPYGEWLPKVLPRLAAATAPSADRSR